MPMPETISAQANKNYRAFRKASRLFEKTLSQITQLERFTEGKRPLTLTRSFQLAQPEQVASIHFSPAQPSSTNRMLVINSRPILQGVTVINYTRVRL